MKNLTTPISRSSDHDTTAQGGFTLIELLVVMAVFVGLLIPAVQGVRDTGERVEKFHPKVAAEMLKTADATESTGKALRDVTLREVSPSFLAGCVDEFDDQIETYERLMEQLGKVRPRSKEERAAIEASIGAMRTVIGHINNIVIPIDPWLTGQWQR